MLLASVGRGALLSRFGGELHPEVHVSAAPAMQTASGSRTRHELRRRCAREKRAVTSVGSLAARFIFVRSSACLPLEACPRQRLSGQHRIADDGRSAGIRRDEYQLHLSKFRAVEVVRCAARALSGVGVMTSARVSRGAAVVVLLLLARQLWLITQGTQGRAQFEALAWNDDWSWQSALAFALAVHVAAALSGRGIEPAPGVAGAARGVDRRHLRRVSGVVALGFIGLHAWSTGAFGGRTPEYDELCASFSATTWGVPWRAAGYLLGIAALAVHVGTGAADILRAWRSWPTPKTAQWLAYGLAVLLALPGMIAVFRLATGSGAIFVGFG